MKDTDSLNVEAAALLEQAKQLPPREPGEKLRPADELRILELHDEGKPQTEIAALVNCHQSTVSRTLAEYHSTVPLAKRYIVAKAHDVAKAAVRAVEEAANRGDVKGCLRYLAKVDVVREDSAASTQVNVGVMLGVQASEEQLRVIVPKITAGGVVAVAPMGDDAA